MNAPHYCSNSKTRSALVGLIWAGMASVGILGCGSSATAPGSNAPLRQVPAPQSTQSLDTPSPERAVTAITHLVTIESDVAGRATLPVYFNVELLVDANNGFQLLNIHRQGTTRSALPMNGKSSAADRSRLCGENSQASQENCDIDLAQLTSEGVVIERLLGRAGVTLRAEKGFSPTSGGRLSLEYIQKANLQDSSQDEMAVYPMELIHQNGQWLLTSVLKPSHGAFSLMKMASDFTGLFATGINSIQVGTSSKNLW